MKMNNVNTNKIDANKPLLRVILAAAAVLILCGIFCGAAGAAATSVTSGGIDWEILNDGTLMITAANSPDPGYQIGQMKNYTIDDPAPWMNSKDRLKKLFISPRVTTIGDYAFYDCSGFTGPLTIPERVTTIGDYAFYGCSGFTGSLTDLRSVTTIGDYAFWGCCGFTGPLTIGSNVTTIGKRAFDGCYGFTGSLTIPESVTTIGNNAFDGCCGFTGSLTIGSSVKTIGNNAFDGCYGFTGSLIIPDSVKTIGDRAFSNCRGFTGSLIIPDSVTTIGIYAFKGCSNFDIIYIAGTPSLIEGKYDTQIPLAATLEGKITEVPEKPNLATPEKAGYTFDGWYRNEDFSGGAVTTYEESGKYYAKWKPLLIKYNNKTFSAASGQPDSIIGGEGSPFNAENAIYDGNTNTLTLKNNVSLTAGTLEIVAPKSDTPFTIDLADKSLIGNGSASVITIGADAELTVTGTSGKITGGSGTTVGTTICGSGVYNEGTFTLNGGTISDNCTGMGLGDKAGCGGGVYNLGTFTMNGGSITENNAQDSGGGVYNKGMFIMNGGTISGNTACPQDLIFDIKCDGGGVYNSGTFTMNNGTISGNTAGASGDSNWGSGGGVCVNSGSTFTMNNGTISGNEVSNSTTDCGGGVYVGGTFIMNNGTISGNSVKDGRTTRGGGVYVAGTFTLNGGEITGNQAESNDTVCGGGGVYVTQGTFNVSGNPEISGNTAQGAVNNVHLGGAEKLTLAGSLTEGADIRISKVEGKQIAVGQQFGRVAEGVTEGFDKFKNDAGTLHGKPGDNHTLIWGTTPTEATTSAPFKSDGGNKKTAAVTESASILQTVTTNESSNVSWLVFKPHETLGDLPVTIDGRDVEIVDDSFKMILGNLKKESQTDTNSVTALSSGEGDIVLQPFPSQDNINPVAGVQATLSGKLSAERIDGQENKLRLAQKTAAGGWQLLPVSFWAKDGDNYTFTADFVSTENGGYMFVIAEGTDPTPAPKSSSSQGTSVWLTAEPTTAPATPAPTETPAPEAPSVKPVEQKPAAQTGASPAPVMGVLAGLGCAAVVFGLRRK